MAYDICGFVTNAVNTLPVYSLAAFGCERSHKLLLIL